MDDTGVMGRHRRPGPDWPRARPPTDPTEVSRQLVDEPAAFEQLQRDKRQAVGLADIKNLHDVGVAKPGDHLGLDAQPFQVVAR